MMRQKNLRVTNMREVITLNISSKDRDQGELNDFVVQLAPGINNVRSVRLTQLGLLDEAWNIPLNTWVTITDPLFGQLSALWPPGRYTSELAALTALETSINLIPPFGAWTIGRDALTNSTQVTAPAGSSISFNAYGNENSPWITSLMGWPRDAGKIDFGVAAVSSPNRCSLTYTKRVLICVQGLGISESYIDNSTKLPVIGARACSSQLNAYYSLQAIGLNKSPKKRCNTQTIQRLVIQLRDDYGRLYDYRSDWWLELTLELDR